MPEVLCPNLRTRGHLLARVRNGEEIAFENGRISDFQGLFLLKCGRGEMECLRKLLRM